MARKDYRWSNIDALVKDDVKIVSPVKTVSEPTFTPTSPTINPTTINSSINEVKEVSRAIQSTIVSEPKTSVSTLSTPTTELKLDEYQEGKTIITPIVEVVPAISGAIPISLGGGGGMSIPSSAKASVQTPAKTSLIKTHWLSLLLVGAGIYILVKKPF